MKSLISILCLLINQILFSQILTEVSTSNFYEYGDFKNIQDSIQKIANQPNSIIIKRCENNKELYLIKNGNNWKGIQITELKMGGIYLPDIEFSDIDGNKHIEKSIKTKIIQFNADSLYRKLVDKNIYNIKQLTEDSIQALYSKEKSKNLKTKKGTKIIYSLPSYSHYCVVSIEISNNSEKTITTYKSSVLYEEELNFISELYDMKIIIEFINEIISGFE